jgi:hypothetical protein
MKKMNAYVDRMMLDVWVDTFCYEDEVLQPAKRDIEKAIFALDTLAKTSVALYGQGHDYMVIGGGIDQFIVYVATADDNFWSLLSEDERPTARITIEIGGQPGDYPAKFVVSLTRVLQAAATFFETGRLDASLQWEKKY